MKKSDLRIVQLDVAGTKKMLFCIPEKLDETWVWYDSQGAFCKAATNQADALAIRDKEVLPACVDK